MSTQQELKSFDNKRIRTFWDDENEKWLFCINDIVGALTDSPDPADYLKTRRKRDKELDSFMRGSICPTHKFISTDGKPHAVKCMDLNGLFRTLILRCQSAQHIQLLYESDSKTGILLGTRKGRLNACLFLYPEPGSDPFLFLVRHSEQGGPPGPLSLAYLLRPNTFEPA